MTIGTEIRSTIGEFGRIRDLMLIGCLLIGQPIAAADVIDDAGRHVPAPDAVRRVVTLSPHATGLAIAAGLGRQLVAISHGGAPPAGYDRLPRLGGAGPLDRERLIALRPDLVIAWQGGNRPQDLAWLDRVGIAVFRSGPRSLGQLADSIRRLGRFSERPSAAEEAARRFEERTRTRCAGLPRRAVYVAVWDRPAMTVGGDHWLNGALEAAGLRNRFLDLPRGIFKVADETRYSLGELPQVSLVRTFDGSPADRLADRLSMPGPGLADAVQALCRWRLGLD